MSDRTVVVLSRNYSTGLSVIRSLGEAGYTVDLIASAAKEGRSLAISKSRYLRSSVEVVSKKVDGEKDEDLLAELLAYRDREPEKSVLIPTDDYTASVMDENRAELTDIFIMPGVAGDGEKLTRYMDKSLQCRIAEETGMAAPACRVVSLRETPVTIPEDMTYPCFCKPLESFTGYKQEMAVCRNRNELSAHLEKLAERFSERSFLVQEYVDIDDEIDIEGVAFDQDVILPGVVYKSIVAQYERGVPLAGEFLPFEHFPGLKEQVRELIKRYHYSGMFDLGINIVGGRYYFNEMNLRSGGTNFVYFKSGVNLPDLFVKGVCGVPHDESEEIPEFGKTYLYEKEGYEDVLHGMLDEDVFRDWEQKAQIKFFVNDDDPEPGEIFISGMEKKLRRKKQRESCINAVMEAKGLEREEARALIRDARERTGISYRDYEKNAFWQYGEEEQEEKYAVILERKERIRQNKEDCIAAAMEDMGWTRQEAVEKIRDARKRLGISYKQYRKHSFHKIPEKKQQIYYDKYIKKKQ